MWSSFAKSLPEMDFIPQFLRCDRYLPLLKTQHPLINNLRSLKPEEVMEVTNMARRIAAILLLEPELDANYQTVKQSTYQWSKEK
jgi:hypothetical protein